MHNIVIYGDGGKRILTKTIVGTCTNYGGALVIGENNICQTEKDPEFTIICTNDASSIDCPGVLVMGNCFLRNSPAVKTENMTIVADSTNDALLPFLKKISGTVIGCSMSPCDTVSLSCNDDSRIVSIRRCITALDGTVTEPCEVIVRSEKEIPVYPVLAASCVLLLCGVGYDDGYSITIN